MSVWEHRIEGCADERVEEDKAHLVVHGAHLVEVGLEAIAVDVEVLAGENLY